MSPLLQLVPNSVKRLIRRYTPAAALARLLSPFLPEIVCVDVGASYFAHPTWRIFLESPSVAWVAVEPNVANISYLDTWPWACRVVPCGTGLSRSGGTKTLYVTNVDSGSSLLEPVIPPSMQHRVANPEYYFPLQEREIECTTLSEVVAEWPQAPVFVKLDTQGSELEILRGAQALFDGSRIVGIELESTLLAQPTMHGAGRFWEACRFLEERGFELLHLNPIQGLSRFGAKAGHGRIYLNECDAVFALRWDLAQRLGVEYRIGLVAFYLSYALYEEAVAFLRADQELEARLASAGCDVVALSSAALKYAGVRRARQRTPPPGPQGASGAVAPGGNLAPPEPVA